MPKDKFKTGILTQENAYQPSKMSQHQQISNFTVLIIQMMERS